MVFIIHILLMALCVFLTAAVLPGISVDGYLWSIVVAFVIGALNAFVRPLLDYIALPLNTLTLGLCTFVIDALIILLAGWLIDAFHVNGFLWALLFSLVLTGFQWLIAWLVNKILA